MTNEKEILKVIYEIDIDPKQSIWYALSET